MKETTRVILADALNEVSPLLPDEVAYSDDLSLWSKTDGVFDSLGLVNFITTVESLISDTLNKEITIVSEKAFSQHNSPFKSMESLGAFIEELLKENK
jgi:hypothetical protein